MTADLGARNVTLRAPGGDLSFTLAGLGRGGTLDVPAGARLGAHANRVTLERDGVTEWYTAGPLGIEQGFTLAQRPSGATGPVRLALRLGGDARAHRDAAGKVFLTRPGGQRLSYGALSAIDARGRSLPASLRVSGQMLEIRVEDRGAAYPLVIDPLIQQGAKILPGGANGVAGLGFEVALSADGNTALVGGPFDNSDVGAAWVFTRTGVTWTQQAKLTGGNEIGTASFGGTVALSADGNTALVGGSGDNSGLGAAWVFTRSGGIWGAAGEADPGRRERNAALRVQPSRCLPTATRRSSAVRPTQATAGRPGCSSAAVRAGRSRAASSRRAVPPIRRSATPWRSRPTATRRCSAGPFDNNAVGAAWVFTRSGTTWTQQGGKLTGSGEVGAGLFGVSVALSADGNTALVGADEDNDFVGSAFTFVRSGGSWSQQGGKITGVSESGQGLFGYDVALAGDGTSALIGGPGDNGDVGAAWQFVRNGTGWLQQGKLTGTGVVGAAGFGTAVALSANGGTAVSGGSEDNNLIGAAWAFITTAPAAPTGVSATAGTSQATVSFTPPLGPVTSYTVSASPGLASATGTSSPIVVDGLANGRLVHVHGHRHERRRHRSGLVAVERGHTGRPAGRADGGLGDGRRRLCGDQLHAAGVERRRRDPLVHGDVLGRPERQQLAQPDRALRADERAELHVHGDGDEQRRGRARLDDVWVGHARRRREGAPRATCADDEARRPGPAERPADPAAAGLGGG